MDAHPPPTNERAGLGRPNANPKSKPKRPLSAFNLFYRFKRQKIVEALAAAEGAAIDRDAIHGVITAPPGLEGVPESATHSAPPDAVHALRRERILRDLEGKTDPRDTRARSHRKNQNALNGAMSFVELGKVMNASWRGCDDFAKSVFNELAQEGRERYRQRVAEYNAGQCEEEPAKAKAAPAPAPAIKNKSVFNKLSQVGRECHRQGVMEYNAQAKGLGRCEEEPAKAMAPPGPAPTNKNKPAGRRLPMKKYIAARVKSSPGPSSNGGDASAPNDAGAMNRTAQAMVQLAAGLVPSKANGIPPMNGNETKNSSTENENCTEAPSLPRLLSSGGEIARATSNLTPQDILTPPCAPRAACIVTPREVPTPPRAPPCNDAEEASQELLRLHVKRLEVQLAEERLRARVRELKAERSRRLLAREDFLRFTLDDSLARNQAAAAVPPIPSGNSFLLDNGLPGYSSRHPSSMLQHAMSERAAALSRIADLQGLRSIPGVAFERPSPMMPGSAFPGSLDFDGRPVKKQRLDSLFAARRG